MNLRSRVGLAGGLVVFGALTLTSVVVGQTVDATLHRQLDASLVDTAATGPAAVLEIKSANAGPLPDDNGIRLTEPVAFGATLLQVIPPSVSVGSASEFGPTDARDVEVAAGSARPYFRDITYRGAAYRLYTARLEGSRGALVRVARPLAEQAATVRLVWLLLAVLTALGPVGAAAFARLSAGRVLRPVVTLTETVEHVAGSGDLTVRVGPAGADEVGRLAVAFTAMMTNLDRSITAQQRLVADASHELRTPLTTLSMNLELLDECSGTSDPQAPVLIQEARTQTAELTALVNDLIDLGRYGQPAAYTEDVRVDLLVADLLARAERRTRGPVYVRELTECVANADPDALQRALGNLLENAVKWSPPAGRIHVRVTQEIIDATPMAEVTITDEGPGIDVADLPYVFDRFFRSARDRSLLGSGLGLAIVRRIAEAHGGTVVAEQATRGARFRFRIPARLESMPSDE